MAIYILLSDKSNRLYIANIAYLALSKEGHLTVNTIGGKVLSFDKEKIKTVRLFTDEASVAGYLSKVIAKIYGQKEQTGTGKEPKNSVK